MTRTSESRLSIIDLICENEELKEENERLKLMLFWKEYGPGELNAAMRLANQAEGGPRCSCLACAVSGRHESKDGEIAEKKPCIFKPWFEQVLRKHKMSIRRGLPDVPIWVSGCNIQSHNKVLDDRHHFINFASQDWCSWSYGSPLWNADSETDPELEKLKDLFWTLTTLDLKEE